MKKPVNTEFYELLILLETIFVGAARFELATSCSQSRRDDRATLRPEYSKNSAEREGFEPSVQV